jgi:hypothetical protein
MDSAFLRFLWLRVKASEFVSLREQIQGIKSVYEQGVIECRIKFRSVTVQKQGTRIVSKVTRCTLTSASGCSII